MQTGTDYNSYNLRVILTEQKLKAGRSYKNFLYLLGINILNREVRRMANGIGDFIANLQIPTAELDQKGKVLAFKEAKIM